MNFIGSHNNFEEKMRIKKELFDEIHQKNQSALATIEKNKKILKDDIISAKIHVLEVKKDKNSLSNNLLVCGDYNKKLYKYHPKLSPREIFLTIKVLSPRSSLKIVPTNSEQNEIEQTHK